MRHDTNHVKNSCNCHFYVVQQLIHALGNYPVKQTHRMVNLISVSLSQFCMCNIMQVVPYAEGN